MGETAVQAVFDTMARRLAEERAETQMTLGELISVLAGTITTRKIHGLVDELDSYRGYYSDLAIYPSDGECTVGELLSRCREAMGGCFDGYKGGGYYMTANTPIWISPYGSASGDRLMGLDIESDPILPITSKQKED